MKQLENLPTEIIMQIIHWLDSTDFLALSLVNRQFHILVTPMLWHAVNINDEVILTQVISALVESDLPVGEYVRSLTLQHTTRKLNLMALMEQLILALAQHGNHLSELNIYLASSPCIPFTAFLPLGGACTLESLKISRGFCLIDTFDDDYSLDGLADFQYLRCLELHCFPSHFTQRLITFLNQSSDCLPHLTHFSMDMCYDLTDQQAIAFMKTHSVLETLSLRYSKLTDIFLEAMPLSLSKIAELDLSLSHGFTANGIRQLVLNCTSLDWIYLEDCNIMEGELPEVQGYRDGGYLCYLDDYTMDIIRNQYMTGFRYEDNDDSLLEMDEDENFVDN